LVINTKLWVGKVGKVGMPGYIGSKSPAILIRDGNGSIYRRHCSVNDETGLYYRIRTIQPCFDAIRTVSDIVECSGSITGNQYIRRIIQTILNNVTIYCTHSNRKSRTIQITGMDTENSGYNWWGYNKTLRKC
jgi:hypothetical protein